MDPDYIDRLVKAISDLAEGHNTIFLQTIHHRTDIENFDGWHLRTAKALKRYAGSESILINPGDVSVPILKIIQGFPVVFVPYRDLNSIPIHRWGHISPSWGKLIAKVLHRLSSISDKVYALIHAPRALNSFLAFLGARKAGVPIVLQHHGEKNYYYYFLRSFAENAKAPIKIINYYLMHKIDCWMAKASKIVYSLVGYDVLYYTKICGARSRISTMGVFFEDLKPVRAKCCDSVKELIYIGGLYSNDWKGSDILIRVYKAMGGRKSGYKLTIVGPIKDPDLYRIGKEHGVIFTGKLKKHEDVIKMLSDSDVYVLTARRIYYWGRAGVAPMEAMALNVPVVSPTLGYIPEEDRRNMGIRIPWADMIPFDEFVRIFKKSLEELEGISISPREYAAKYFDWRVIVKGYRRDLGV